MEKRKVLVSDLAKENNLQVLYENNGLQNEILEDQITMPGLLFSGYYDYYFPDRVIIIGTPHAKYLELLYENDKEEVLKRLDYILSKRPPALIYSINVEVIPFILPIAEKYNVPILKSDLRTTELNYKLFTYLEYELAPRLSVHGVLLDINGMGTLITGKSGIGKSETALELIKRGHQLISDDRVDIFEKEVGTLVGESPASIAGFMEVRGIGIVNVLRMFGASAYRENKKIRLVIELERWDSEKDYDRLGLVTKYEKFFHTEIIKISIPVLPGRNVASLIEAAAMQVKLKYLGYDAPQKFVESINKKARGEE